MYAPTAEPLKATGRDHAWALVHAPTKTNTASNSWTDTHGKHLQAQPVREMVLLSRRRANAATEFSPTTKDAKLKLLTAGYTFFFPPRLPSDTIQIRPRHACIKNIENKSYYRSSKHTKILARKRQPFFPVVVVYIYIPTRKNA